MARQQAPQPDTELLTITPRQDQAIALLITGKPVPWRHCSYTSAVPCGVVPSHTRGTPSLHHALMTSGGFALVPVANRSLLFCPAK